MRKKRHEANRSHTKPAQTATGPQQPSRLAEADGCLSRLGLGWDGFKPTDIKRPRLPEEGQEKEEDGQDLQEEGRSQNPLILSKFMLK